MPYALYYATTPPPKRIEPEVLQRLVWLIEGPDVRLGAAQVEEKCKATLEMFKRAAKK